MPHDDSFINGSTWSQSEKYTFPWERKNCE